MSQEMVVLGIVEFWGVSGLLEGCRETRYHFYTFGVHKLKNMTEDLIPMRCIAAAANVTADVPGGTITLTLAPEFHYEENGAETPLREGGTVRVASTNAEATIVKITDRTKNAWQFQVRPKRADQSLNSAGSPEFLASDFLVYRGDMEPWESVSSMDGNNATTI